MSPFTELIVNDEDFGWALELLEEFRPTLPDPNVPFLRIPELGDVSYGMALYELTARTEEGERIVRAFRAATGRISEGER